MADIDFSRLSRCTGLVRLAWSHEAWYMAYPFGEFNARVRALGEWLDRKVRGAYRPVRGTGVQPA